MERRIHREHRWNSLLKATKEVPKEVPRDSARTFRRRWRLVAKYIMEKPEFPDMASFLVTKQTSEMTEIQQTMPNPTQPDQIQDELKRSSEATK
jgi:hypothetical protein